MKAAMLVSIGCAVVLGMTAGAVWGQGAPAVQSPESPGSATGSIDRVQAEQKLDETWGQLSVEEKRSLMRFHKVMNDLPPEQRKMIRQRIDRVLSMTPAQRERLQQNLKRWQQMTPQERQKAREEFRRNKQAFDEQWRRDHPDMEMPPP